MRNNVFLSLLLAFLFVGCGQEATSDGTANDSQVSSFEDVYADAVEALASAEDSRNVWNKTEEMLSDARTAFDNGDFDSAIELATEARLQAKLALKQAHFEEDAWRSRVLSE